MTHRQAGKWPSVSGPRVVVLGGGVMGCAVAAELARGGCAVTVLERAVPGAEASSAAAGMLGAQTESDGPGPMLTLALASRSLWPQFAADLQQRTGIGVGHVQHGTLELALDTAGLAQIAGRHRWMRECGLAATLLNADHARRVEPALGPAVLGALLLPDDHQIEPPLLARALAQDARLAGAEVVTGQTVTAIQYAGPGVLVEADSGQWQADYLVVAAGAWSDLIPGIAGLPRRRSAISPVHGQLLQLDPRRSLFRHNLVQHSSDRPGGYLVPRPDGRVIVGATTEHTGYAKQVTAAGVAHLLQLALTAVPNLHSASMVQTWSGLRPHSADGLPLLGPLAALPHVVFATGHYRNGILLTPVTARVVADSILSRKTWMDLAPFAP
jgi:glycine oxidase